jgi:hypothetical protein
LNTTLSIISHVIKSCLYGRKINDDTYQGTTWQIKFKLDQVDTTGAYKLRLALATAHVSELQVYGLHDWSAPKYWHWVIIILMFMGLIMGSRSVQLTARIARQARKQVLALFQTVRTLVRSKSHVTTPF